MEQNRLFIQFLRSKGFDSIELNPDQSVNFYTSVDEELELLSSGTVCRDLSTRALISLTGSDALDFLHRISTNDLKSLEPFRIKKTHFTNDKGRMLDSAVLLHLNDQYLLVGSEGRAKLLNFWLKKYIINDDVKVSVINEEYSLFEFSGPEVTPLMILLFGDAGKELRLNVINQREFSHQTFSVIPVSENNGSARYFVLGKTVSLMNLLNTCLECKSIVDLRFVGSKAYDIYRLENGIPGPDEINDQFNPHELQMLDEVSFTKGCYIGQEVITRLQSYNKVQKYLRSFVISEPIDTALPLILYDENNLEVGQITSMVKSPKFNNIIGLGFAGRNFSQEGTVLYAKNGHGTFAVSVKLPGRFE